MLSYQHPVWTNYRSYYITESQNFWGWRDLWRSPGPSPLPQAGPPRAHDHVQTPFDYLQGWRDQNLHGPMVSLPHSKKVFPDVQREPPKLPFAPIASGPITGQPWKSQAFTVHSDIYKNWIISSSVCKVPALSFSLLKRCSRFVIIFVILCWALWTHIRFSTSLFCWGAQKWKLHTKCGLTGAE